MSTSVSKPTFDRSTEQEILGNLCQSIGDDGLPDVEITGTRAKVGSKYTGDLMVVGRAPNGWSDGYRPTELHDRQRQSAFLNELCEEGDNQCPLQWVIDDWPRSRKPYSTGRSAFWRTARRVALELQIQHSTEQTWSSFLVWSNLYKIAPSRGGNPSWQLQRIQFGLCRQLLEWEIKTFRPRHLVFATGEWATPFVKDNPMFDQVPFTASQYIKSRGRILLKNGQLGTFVVVDHPQGKDEGNWVNLVLNALQCN